MTAALDTGLLALMALASIRFQPNVRCASAFMSAMALGFLMNEATLLMNDHPVATVFLRVWMVITLLRIVVGAPLTR